MALINPRVILGKWKKGYALDLHTLSSIYIGDDGSGYPRFDTVRSEIGELLFRLKNRSDLSAVPEIVAATEKFLKEWRPPVDIIVPVPPSSNRTIQPVMVLAQALSKQLQIPLSEVVQKTRDTPQLKEIFDLDKRLQVLEGAFFVEPERVAGQQILLFDDLFRSGATMDAISDILYRQGGAKEIYALTVTRTRVNQ